MDIYQTKKVTTGDFFLQINYQGIIMDLSNYKTVEIIDNNQINIGIPRTEIADLILKTIFQEPKKTKKDHLKFLVMKDKHYGRVGNIINVHVSQLAKLLLNTSK